jgi:hypothetical protein
MADHPGNLPSPHAIMASWSDATHVAPLDPPAELTEPDLENMYWGFFDNYDSSQTGTRATEEHTASIPMTSNSGPQGDGSHPYPTSLDSQNWSYPYSQALPNSNNASGGQLPNTGNGAAVPVTGEGSYDYAHLFAQWTPPSSMPDMLDFAPSSDYALPFAPTGMNMASMLPQSPVMRRAESQSPTMPPPNAQRLPSVQTSNQQMVQRRAQQLQQVSGLSSRYSSPTQDQDMARRRQRADRILRKSKRRKSELALARDGRVRMSGGRERRRR